jgi:hypothetical protein
MRFPSIQRLSSSAQQTAARFPFVLGAAVIATAAGILNIEHANHPIWERAEVSAVLGFPLLLALALWAERRGWQGRRRIGVGVVGALVLLSFFLLWPNWSEPVAWTRFWQLSVAFHLLAAFLPYAGRNEPNGFWQYNRALLLRAVTAALFSLVLWTGLAIALRAVEVLFGIDVPGERYGQAMVVLFFLFNTWFFLGGVPRDFAVLERSEDYPAEVKVFTQYVLLPIVTVYIAILTAYLVKVIVTWEWPSGWIGWLVSGVASAGILALLLVYPVREREENRWVDSYARWFWIVLLPAIVMLWLAIWQRVDQYGVTERRYFLTILSIWLAGIAVYYTLRGSQRIILIPASLCVLALATFAGPWSPYATSRRSQTHRLEEILTRNGMLEEGTIRQASTAVDFLDRREINAILRYLLETHGTGSIEDWFGGQLAAIDSAGTRPSRSGQAEERVRLIVAHLGLGYVDRWQRGTEEHFNYFAQQTAEPISIADYDYTLYLDGLLHDSAVVTGQAVLVFDSAGMEVQLLSAGERLIGVPLLPLLERAAVHQMAEGDGAIPRDTLRATAETDAARIAIYITAISGVRSETGPVLSSLSATAYVRIK